MQELSVRFVPPDITGIPPPPPDDNTIPVATNASATSNVPDAVIPVATDVPDTIIPIATNVPDTIIPIATNVPDTIIPVATVVSSASKPSGSSFLDTSLTIPALDPVLLPGTDLPPLLPDGFHGPGQTSPSVKLLSPESFLISPGVLKSPSDFKTPLLNSITSGGSDVCNTDLDVSVTESLESESREDSLKGTALVTLPLGKVAEPTGEEEMILPVTTVTTPTVTTPTALSTGNAFPSALSEATPSVQDEPWSDMVLPSVKSQAVTIVSTILFNALSAVDTAPDTIDTVPDATNMDTILDKVPREDVLPDSDTVSLSQPDGDIVSAQNTVSPQSHDNSGALLQHAKQDTISSQVSITVGTQLGIKPETDMDTGNTEVDTATQDMVASAHVVCGNDIGDDIGDDQGSDISGDRDDDISGDRVDDISGDRVDDISGDQGNVSGDRVIDSLLSLDKPLPSTDTLLKLLYDKLNHQEQQLELLR